MGGVHKLCTARFGSDKNIANKMWYGICSVLIIKACRKKIRRFVVDYRQYGMEGNTSGTQVMYNGFLITD